MSEQARLYASVRQYEIFSRRMQYSLPVDPFDSDAGREYGEGFVRGSTVAQRPSKSNSLTGSGGYT